MIPHRYNEETSLLLQQEQLIAAKTPLPWDQFWIILVLHFSQSLVFKTLAPFIPQVSTYCLLLGVEDWPNRIL